MGSSSEDSGDKRRGWRRLELSKVAFVAASVLLLFMLGVAVGRYKLFPFSLIKVGQDSIEQVFAERSTISKVRPEAHLRKAREDGNGVTVINAGQMAPGLTFMSGFFDRGLEMRLIQADGSIVHRWPVRFYSVFSDTGHIKKEWVPQSDWNAEIHGAIAFPDGSVLFNFEEKGLVRMDRCGAVQWTLARMTHHSLAVSHDGGYWVPSLRTIDRASPIPALTPPYKEDTILKVSPDGKVLQEISVLEVLFENNLEAYLFANGPEGSGLSNWDPTHVNDVEELSREMATHFAQFAAGDLLVSLRNLNMVLVVDPATRRVKWHRTGLWMDQHDPDFQADGKITVFSNNNDRTELGSILGGSTIVEVDPAGGATRIRFGGNAKERWFTPYRGKHQIMENGNTLIVESHAGRVIEVTPAGDTVWKFVNRYDTEYVAYVIDAIRYPPGHFKVKEWACAK
jgi:hypothetical protein